MQKRSIAALVLIGYSAILINAVVFKGPLAMVESVRPGREERVEGGRQGRGRGASRTVDGSESRIGDRTGPGLFARPYARLSTSRFSPIHANYVPFRTILPQLRGLPRWSSAIINLVGNTVLFVPVGFLVLLVYRTMNWQKAFVVAVAVGVTMEVVQGVLRVGVVDVDDVILNGLGVMSGYWVCRVWERRKEAVLLPA